jgi:CHASE2 domain-containing sensor protein
MPDAVKRKPEVAFAGEIGRQAVIFDEDDVVRLLRAAVEREGSQTALRDAMALSALGSMLFYPANDL